MKYQATGNKSKIENISSKFQDHWRNHRRDQRRGKCWPKLSVIPKHEYHMAKLTLKGRWLDQFQTPQGLEFCKLPVDANIPMTAGHSYWN
jgi:hypothetical protein